MKVTNIKDCFKFRLLRKINPDLGKSKKSMEVAESRIKKAERAIKLRVYDFAVLESYMAMFHSSRALLYRDGVQEKSHYAVYIYLKTKYRSKIPISIINLLNIHRTERHEAMYGLEYKAKKDDAVTALEDAKVFVGEIKKLLK